MAKVNITQVRSRIGSTKIQKRNLDALGLRKIGKTVQHEDSPVIMGMLDKVRHLVKVEMNAQPLDKEIAKKAPRAEKKVTAAEPKAVKKAAADIPAGEKKPKAAKKPAAKAPAQENENNVNE